jgi:UDPglucose 6-dehydrogenase
MKIGIIGVGFVGRAIKAAYQNTQVEIVLRDPAQGYTSSIEDLKKANCIFVCVPSPPRNDGSCDTSILEQVLKDLQGYTGVVVSKVTAPPGQYKQLQEQYYNLVYAPEFLTAANAVNDYINSKFVIIGGHQDQIDLVEDIIVAPLDSNIEVRRTDIATASLAKYTINSFLATKVAFMNEVYDVATAAGIEYTALAELVSLDTRIGSSHMRVPGPDGRGFAGACFPKDTAALASYAHKVGQDMFILEQAIRSNKLHRMDK